MARILAVTFVLIGLAGPLVAEQLPRKLQWHVVPSTLKSYRLLAMSMDADGFIWAGSIHQAIHRYDPRTGSVETIPLPARVTASSCICAGKKVYVLGQTYPRLLIYDRFAKTFKEANPPTEKLNVWYGTPAVDGRHLFLFDQTGAGVIRWDTQTDTGKVIPYPYKTPLPGSGQYEPGDKAIWSRVADNTGGKYVPLGLARLDGTRDAFTDWYPFPNDDKNLKPYTDPTTTLFLPYTLQGKVVPFDFKERRWCQFLSVPRHGELFGFMGGPTRHQGRFYFPLSTYNGTDKGCDGKPYHFCNAILEFDPQTRRFEFLTLEAKEAYYQIAYLLSAGGALYATGSNIREPDGQLKPDRTGEVVFWQTRPPGRR